MSSRTIFALVCCLNLATGVLVGVVVDRTALAGPRGVMGPGGPPSIDSLTSRLDLTQEQAVKVRAIFEKRHPQIEAILDEVRPKLDTFQEEADAELRTILTPEQWKRFENSVPRIGHKGRAPGFK
jgi:Spy/CpxP family protein refolding chaperone